MDGLEKELDKKIDAVESEAREDKINVVDEDAAQLAPEAGVEDSDAAAADQAEGMTEEGKNDKTPEADEPEDKAEEKAAEATEAKPAKEKKIFKRKKDKQEEKIEELTDRLTRQMAEFDNFRKRTEKEKSAMFDMGAKDVIEKILPIVDNFERGFDAAKDTEEGDSFMDGMQKVYKQLVTALTDLGVTPIEACGCDFDPNLHNAVMHVDDEEAGENTVVEEFQKGYLYKGSVVRHSMVKVAN